MTTVVAVITENELVVGADSKVTWQVKGDFEETACKIHQVGNKFFSFAGIGGDLVSGFSVADIATKAIQSSKTFPEILASFDLHIQPPLYHQFQMLRVNHPTLHAQLLESGGPLDIMFSALRIISSTFTQSSMALKKSEVVPFSRAVTPPAF